MQDFAIGIQSGGCGPEPWDRGRSWRHMAFLLGHWQLAGEYRSLGDRAQRGVLDGQHVFRKVTNATESLRTHARSLVDPRFGITADIGALD
jgi:hypothetical protein